MGQIREQERYICSKSKLTCYMSFELKVPLRDGMKVLRGHVKGGYVQVSLTIWPPLSDSILCVDYGLRVEFITIPTNKVVSVTTQRKSGLA